MKVLEHFAQKKAVNACAIIAEAIRQINSGTEADDGCAVCFCKDLRLKHSCNLIECSCVPATINGLPKENAIYGAVIYIFTNCFLLDKSNTESIISKTEEIAQKA